MPEREVFLPGYWQKPDFWWILICWRQLRLREYGDITVYRRLRAAVITTGDELQNADTSLESGKSMMQMESGCVRD